MEQKTPNKPIENKGLSDNKPALSLGQNFGAYGDASTSPMPEKELDKAPPKKKSPWDEEKRPWSSTVDGRFAIRTFSRGVMGAAFFAAGGVLASKALEGYSHTQSMSQQWTPSTTLKDNFKANNNPLRVLAKCIDTVAGRPIEAVFGSEAVTFRDTRVFNTMGADGVMKKQFGRSLGHEAVGITFDFAMASIGDAWGRNIAGIFDPNVKKDWLKDGKVDFPQLAKDTLKSTWKILSYNQAEDWAVAIPYAYQMKFQRKALDHFFPGFRMDFDHQLNGASVRVNDKGGRTGDYALPGAIDLQLRFTGYNVGTLMYREAYNKVGTAFNDWKETGYKMPEIKVSANPLEIMKSVDEKVGELAKYVVKSAVKGTIFMTPSVPFFWTFRTSQSKHRGLAINPTYEHDGVHDMHDRQKGGYMVYTNPDHTGVYSTQVRATGGPSSLTSDPAKRLALEKSATFLAPHVQSGVVMDSTQILAGEVGKTGSPFYNHGLGMPKDPFLTTGGMTDEILNPLGRLSNAVADKTAKPVAAMLGKFGVNKSDALDFNRNHINAAFSYTPYMYAKAEFANVWDNAHMDMAIYEAIDGALEFDKNKFKTGVKEIGRAIAKQMPEKKEWRDIVKEDLDANRKVDVQSMSQSELGPKARHRMTPKSSSWQEQENKRNTEEKSPVPGTVH